MHLEHNSYEEFYRRPFGAVAVGTTVQLRLAISSTTIPGFVRIVVNGEEMDMYYSQEAGGSRIYETEVYATEPGLLFYTFHVEADGEEMQYGNNMEGLGGKGTEGQMPAGYQITVYEPYQTPEWFKHAVVYQIFPDSFARSGETPIPGFRHEWQEGRFFQKEQFGGDYLCNDYYGGNLWGVIEKLPYLKELGINAIYLNPIFQANTNHRYNTGDYEVVDASLGGNAAFDALIENAEKLGIAIILDGVFNHTGDDSKYFNKKGQYPSVGAYQSQMSPYYSWYRFIQYPDRYHSWWGFDTLPETDKDDPDFVQYILESEDSIVKRWLKRGAAGWRLDVADELPDAFLKKLRQAVKHEKSDAVILGEVWEDASNKEAYGMRRQYFQGQELDGVMNYPLRNAIVDFFAGSQNGWLLYQRLMSLYENYPMESLYSCLNILGTHDVSRILTVLGNAPEGCSKEEEAAYRLPDDKRQTARQRLMAAFGLLFALPGAPCIYYGDEAGMEGYRDPFCRTAYPWGAEDREILELCRCRIALRNQYVALQTGYFRPVYGSDGLFVFIRETSQGMDVFGKEAENATFLICVSNEVDAFTLDLGRFRWGRLVPVAGDVTVDKVNQYQWTFHMRPTQTIVLMAEKERE